MTLTRRETSLSHPQRRQKVAETAPAARPGRSSAPSFRLTSPPEWLSGAEGITSEAQQLSVFRGVRVAPSLRDPGHSTKHRSSPWGYLLHLRCRATPECRA